MYIPTASPGGSGSETTTIVRQPYFAVGEHYQQSSEGTV